MGAGEFISGRSEAQVQRTEIEKELEEMRSNPAFELRELAALLEHEGVGSKDAARIAPILAHYPRAYQQTMVEKELGLQANVSTVKTSEALTMGIS